MKPFTQYLVERLSTVLYHATDLRGALGVMSKNRFRLSQANETDVDALHNKGKFFYMSFSRSKGSDFIKTRLDNYTIPIVNFEVDGNILSQRYQSNPVGHFSDNHNSIDEFEDRLISDKHYIEDASKYIKSIHVFFEPSSKVKESLEELAALAKQHGDPIYFYNDSKSFILMNTRNTVNINAQGGRVDNAPINYHPDQLKVLQGAEKDLQTLLAFGSKTKDQLSGAELRELTYLTKPDERYQMTNRINDMLRIIRNDDRLDDIRIQLQQLMNKYKVRTMSSLIDTLVQRLENGENR